jgi:uncharacterized LabA/DUF88 family protein
MEKVAVFIDGFNMYYSIVEAGLPCYKWLNYRSLANAFIKQSSEKIEDIYYFSALHRGDLNK